MLHYKVHFLKWFKLFSHFRVGGGVEGFPAPYNTILLRALPYFTLYHVESHKDTRNPLVSLFVIGESSINVKDSSVRQ